jgi:transaldolase
MDLIQLAEIGLLSDCDAVCVSAEQAEKLKWSRVPTTSLDDYGPEHPAVFRARQAKYPMDLLKNAKGIGAFSSWLSPESRNMTCEVLHEVLQEMESQMALIEQAVEIEIQRRYEQGTIKLKDLYRNSEAEANSVKGTKSKKSRLDLEALFEPVTGLKVDQAMDEVL